MTLSGPFIEMQFLKQKLSKKKRGALLSETFERCVDKMVAFGMGIKHDSTNTRLNGHPLILQVNIYFTDVSTIRTRLIFPF